MSKSPTAVPVQDGDKLLTNFSVSSNLTNYRDGIFMAAFHIPEGSEIKDISKSYFQAIDYTFQIENSLSPGAASVSLWDELKTLHADSTELASLLSKYHGKYKLKQMEYKAPVTQPSTPKPQNKKTTPKKNKQPAHTTTPGRKQSKKGQNNKPKGKRG